MNLKGLLIATVLGLGLVTSAHAQQGRRLGFPPSYTKGFRFLSGGLTLTGDCAKTPPAGLTFTRGACFADDSYTADGISSAGSFAGLPSASVGAGCANTAASGAQCTGSSAFSFNAGNPSVNYFVVVSATPSSSSTGENSVLTDGTNVAVNDYQSAAGTRKAGVGGQGASTTTISGQVAVCVSSTSSAFVSIAGAAATSLTTTGAPNASSLIYVANSSSGSLPNGSGSYVRSVRIFTGTCNAANVQAASAN